MEDRVRRFREMVRRELGGKAGRGVRYSAALRDEAVACALDALGGGSSLEEVASELGVSGPTLSRWLEGRRGALRRVEVMAQDVAAEIRREATALAYLAHAIAVAHAGRGVLVALWTAALACSGALIAPAAARIPAIREQSTMDIAAGIRKSRG